MYNTYWDYASLFLYIAQALAGVLCLKNACMTNRGISKRLAWKPFFLLVLWTFFATFRLVSYGVGGTDSMNYIQFFENSWGTFDEIQEHTASDVAFLWINKAIRLLSSDYHVYFAMVYGFIAYSIIQFIRRFRYKFFCSIPLLLAFYLFLRGYNTLRSNLAIAFILLGLINVVDKKYRWAYFYMLCSALTHKAGVLFALSIPYLHFVMVRGLKIKYLVIAALLIFAVASSLRDYFIVYASLNDLGGSYESYALGAKESGGLLKSITECFMQYLLAVVLLFSTHKIKHTVQCAGKEVTNVSNALLYICYFDMMLIPLNAALGIWRGYEFFYIPRLCMWGLVIYVYTYKFRESKRFIMNALIFIYFVTWFVFRLNRTYEASDLMPYVLELF